MGTRTRSIPRIYPIPTATTSGLQQQEKDENRWQALLSSQQTQIGRRKDPEVSPQDIQQPDLQQNEPKPQPSDPVVEDAPKKDSDNPTQNDPMHGVDSTKTKEMWMHRSKTMTSSNFHLELNGPQPDAACTNEAFLTDSKLKERNIIG